MALFAAGRIPARAIVAGQALGIGALFAASAGAAALLVSAPLRVVGLLGLVPIVMGLRGLWALRGPAPDVTGGQPVVFGALAVAALTVANGGDNLGAYVPWFATLTSGELAITGLVFAFLTFAWCAIARSLTGPGPAGTVLRRHGPWIALLALVAVGAAVLARAGTVAWIAG